MKVVLLGSPAFVIETFETVRQHFNVVAVVTQPPRPSGRGLKLTPTPVALWAKSHSLKLFEPEKISLIFDELVALKYDIMLTFAFGQWIPPRILALGSYPPLNIHGSLLPKYRGAAPVQHAVLNGDSEIGITLMQMVTEMDAGPMFFKAKAPLIASMNASEATTLIANLAKANIVQWLEAIKHRAVKPEHQSVNFSLSPKFPPEFAELKSDATVSFNLRKVLALSELPGAYFYDGSLRIKVFRAQREANAQFLKLRCHDGVLYISDYQIEGKKRTTLF